MIKYTIVDDENVREFCVWLDDKTTLDIHRLLGDDYYIRVADSAVSDSIYLKRKE